MDESLFLEKSSVAGGGKPRTPSGSSGVLKRGGLATAASVGAGVAAPAVPAVIVRRSDIERMREAAVIKTREDLEHEAAAAAREAEDRQAAARARKAKILSLEEERKSSIPLSVLEREEKERNEAILVRARVLAVEQLDDVKAMNAKLKYAQTVRAPSCPVAMAPCVRACSRPPARAWCGAVWRR